MAEMKVYLALLLRGYTVDHVDHDTAWDFKIGRVPRNGLPFSISRSAAGSTQQA